MRVLDTHPDDDPDHVTRVASPDNGSIATVTPLTLSQPNVDYAAIAAQLHVEIATDGSVLVHGIPEGLPHHVGLHVAHIAAQAATQRLERILLGKPSINRDDRRLLTKKVAREAVRGQRFNQAI